MKPLVLALLSAFVCSPGSLRAAPVPGEDAAKELKEKFKNQKPAAGQAPGSGESPGMKIADLETLLLKTPGCTKNPDDTKDLAANLKGKYGIISCKNEIDGLQQIILVPKSAQYPAQQAVYGNSGSIKIQRARFFDHYLILQFDKQVQYLDLLKSEKDSNGRESLVFAGYVAENGGVKEARMFADVDIFIDALKNHLGIKEDAPELKKIPELVKAAVGGKRFRAEASFPKGKLAVFVMSEGNATIVWPEPK